LTDFILPVLGLFCRDVACNYPVETLPATSLRRNIQEAQGWIVRADGVIELVTNPPHGTPQPTGVLPPQCLPL
jgi:hypothetical protein